MSRSRHHRFAVLSGWRYGSHVRFQRRGLTCFCEERCVASPRLCSRSRRCGLGIGLVPGAWQPMRGTTRRSHRPTRATATSWATGDERLLGHRGRGDLEHANAVRRHDRSGVSGQTQYIARRTGAGWAAHSVTPQPRPEAYQTFLGPTLPQATRTTCETPSCGDTTFPARPATSPSATTSTSEDTASRALQPVTALQRTGLPNPLPDPVAELGDPATGACRRMRDMSRSSRGRVSAGSRSRWREERLSSGMTGC